MHLATEMPFEENAMLLEAIPPNQTPGQRMSRSDVHFPLTTPRKRNPSVPLTHAVTEDGQSSGIPRLRTSSKHDLEMQYPDRSRRREGQTTTSDSLDTRIDDKKESRNLNMQDLPEEIVKRILDYIFGDMRPVNSASTSTGLSHRMRHPRRKAVSELALISPEMRIMVQERIYRHIKIKGTNEGLRESRQWFQHYPHLAQFVRHIEYWVPVWGDKAPMSTQALQQQLNQQQQGGFGLAAEMGLPGVDFPGQQFKLSTGSASLDQMFEHLGSLFTNSSIFTLEGGHCKNSNMIKHFKSNLFGKYMQKRLRVLPNIKVFAMRGAWNVMRSFDDWNTIQEALPCLTEWHCGYAKPRTEAYSTINEILLQLPGNLRRVDISLDSMFSKDDTILGSSPDKRGHHICEQLGRIAPRLESLSYTGKICECFWMAAVDAIEHDKSKSSTLKALDIVVKSCCRQRIKSRDNVTGDVLVEEIGGIMADGAGIGNLVFINAFERLVSGAIDGIGAMSSLAHVKVRYIDLDSPCQQLNPYWSVEDRLVTGIWNDRIVEKLAELRPDMHYERLEDGIGAESGDAANKKESDHAFENEITWSSRNSGLTGVVGAIMPGIGVNALYPRTIPKSINTSSYKVLSDARTG